VKPGEVTVDPAQMRDVLGHFASGVVVVTAAGPAGPLGFTCQSFASLSLDPARTPLLFHRGRYGLARPDCPQEEY
jgi:flavin reductase (DIM6/NTAB) family NADH-FMN oxidoreductase RutF